MNGNEVMLLGLGLTPPWKLVDQELDVERKPHELHLHIEADRGAQYPCPECGKLSSAHDFKDQTWRHLNFFQHHCYVHVRMPRVRCSEHGVKQVKAPWARQGSAFTLLFEQAAMMLVREMPVLAASRIMEITDKRLWRVVEHYVGEAVSRFDLSSLRAIGLDETASKRGQNYVTVFIDMDRRIEPVLFVTPGHGKETVKSFRQFMKSHQGNPGRVREVVCDMSKAFLAGVGEEFPEAQITVDWFHIVQTFTRAVDDVRKMEGRDTTMPKHLRWAILKRAEAGRLTENQVLALGELASRGLETSTAWRLKESLRWIREASSPRAAKWRITRFVRFGEELLGESPVLEPMRKALQTLQAHAHQIVRRWTSTYTNARLEGLNGLFQAARARARGYRNTETFISMIYLIASPAASILKST